MFYLSAIVTEFDLATARWHLPHPAEAATAPQQHEARTQSQSPEDFCHNELLPAALALHQANFQLWHEEDKARDLSAADAQVAAVKRSIDRINQQRNDRIEQCDALALGFLATLHLPRAGAPLHSETPGLMLDRLSILTLKLYHTQEEISRPAAPAGHAERNQQRLEILLGQRKDLAGCLDDLWQAVLLGERRFKLYRQLKMYNDPALNPVVYLAGS